MILLGSVCLNYDAYRGWFEDDDLDTLTWARLLILKQTALQSVAPAMQYPPPDARPVGHLYYGFISQSWGLDYPKFVWALGAIHIFNIGLIWLILRALQLDARSAAVGCLFFAFHRALFDAWWKPMFVYDVTCGTFTFLCLLAYFRRQWILSFLAFWMALHSKEIAVTLPAILLCYELLLGDRNWKRTIVFFLPAAVTGIQGLLFGAKQPVSDYTFQFTPAALWTTVSFYSTRLLWLPYAGLVLIPLLFLVRDRRIYFGAAAVVLGLGVYLALPGRLFAIYLYTGMAGAAIVTAVLAARYPRPAVLLTFLWLGYQCVLIRSEAATTIAAGSERQAYVSALRAVPDATYYSYERPPTSMRHWGVEGALRLYHGGIERVRDVEASAYPAGVRGLLLVWDSNSRRLSSTQFPRPESSWVRMDGSESDVHLLKGWQPAKQGFRAILPLSAVRLYQPPGADEFEWVVCIDAIPAGDQPGELRTFIGGEGEQPVVKLAKPGCVTRRVRVSLPGELGRVVTTQFLTAPEGVAIRLGPLGYTASRQGPARVKDRTLALPAAVASKIRTGVQATP